MDEGNDTSSYIPLTTKKEVVDWTVFSALNPMKKFTKTWEISVDENYVEFDDSMYTPKKRYTKFLSTRNKYSVPSSDLFKSRYDEIYQAIMINAGDHNTTIQRRVPTLIDAVGSAGGLYWPCFAFSYVFAFIFFKPIDDLLLYHQW